MKEFEINNFLGIATSTRHPKQNECQECLNFDTRYIDGDLILRPGFTQKYPVIANADHRTKLSNLTYLGFANFIPEGTTQEVTVWVVKATLAAETSYVDPGILEPDSINIITLFSSHQYVGSSWVGKNWDGTTNGKYWLNHTLLTIIDNVTTSPNENQLRLDFVDSTLVADGLNGWSIYNVDRNDVAQVIDTVNAGSNQVRVDITKTVHNWVNGDTVVLMKNFIPYESLTGMYSCVAGDITFHKILNDLRVGFGGQANRIGLSIGYRKRALLVGDIDFGSYNADNIEDLVSINNLILTTYIPTNEGNTYRIGVTPTTGSGNELPVGKYFLKLSAVTDYFNEYLVAETSYIIGTVSDLIILPLIKLGSHHKNITSFRLYIATTENVNDNIPTNPYFLLDEFTMVGETFNEGVFTLNNDGYLSQPTTQPELNIDPNAAIIHTTDYDTPNGTPATGFFPVFMVNITSESTGVPHHLLYHIEAERQLYPGRILFKYVPGFTLKAGTEYAISFYAKLSVAGYGGIGIYEGSTLISTYITNTYRECNFRIKVTSDTTEILIEADFPGSLYSVFIDYLSIKKIESTGYTSLDILALKTEMTDKAGYSPTFDMIKSWDQAVVTQGRTFFVNPYIEKRYENKIFSSHISGAGAFMYDVASAERLIDLENFDGNKLVGIEILPNLQFVAFKTNGSQRVDPNTGQTRGINFGDGCISRRSIVNFGDRVIWCGENDIYMTDGLNIVSIADKTIREAYRALTTKANIIATREEKDNAYRFFTGDATSKTEYIFTKKGWIKRTTGASIYPTAYYLESSGQVNFLHNGIIYDDDEGNRDASTNSIIGEWKSVDIDAELLGPEITERDFFYVASIWLDYTRNIGAGDDPNMQLILTMDGTVVHTDNFETVFGRQKYFVQIPTEKYIGRRFNITVKIVSDSEAVSAKHISLHAVGGMLKTVKTGHYN